MVVPVSDVEMYMVVPTTPVIERSKRLLSGLFAALVILGFAHLGYKDFWGFVLDVLFALLGYVTFKRLQLSTLAFFSFLCAFNAGVDLIASINLVSALASDTATLDILKSSLGLEQWQIVLAAAVVTMDAIVMSTCLMVTCKVYSDLRSLVYSQMGGMFGQPLLGDQQTTAQPPPVQTFVPFQGRAHRISS
jgi:hypothetical protein